MNELVFNITNNPWINNGICRLACVIDEFFHEKITSEIESNFIRFFSDEDLSFYINESIKFLAANGTYNFSSKLKRLNKESNEVIYSKPKNFPESLEDIDKLAQIDERNQVKYWSLRGSFSGDKNKYINFGLDLRNQNVFKSFLDNEYKKNLCPSCGSFSNKMVDNKQFYNPLIGENQNNELEGFNQSKEMRKNIKICPNCHIASLVSFFDKFIPFYGFYRDSFIFLPNIKDFKILFKIIKNLSIHSQYIDFADDNVLFYGSNIKSFNNKCNSSALLSILHNIQNNYSKDRSNFFQELSQEELESIVDWIYIHKIKLDTGNNFTFKIYRISANSNVYKILKPQKNPWNENDVYLLNDFFNMISINDFSDFELEQFYDSFLQLSYKGLSECLFRLAKHDISNLDVFNNGFALKLFEELFLKTIFDEIEEIKMINEDLKESCREIAKSIGKSFYKDIGVLTKFAYATNSDVFKGVIEESSFLMTKKSISDDDSTIYLSANDLENILDNLNDDNFNEIKSYFISFMCSSAINKNYFENKQVTTNTEENNDL